MRHAVANALATLLLAAPSTTPANPAEEGEAPSIVHLAFRDHIVSIAASPDGPRYSVRAKSGALLGEDLSEQQLLAAHPELHTLIRGAVAGDDSGSFVWAGSDERLIEAAPDAVVNPE